MEKMEWKWEIGCILIVLLFNLDLSAQGGLQYLPCQVCPVNTPAQNFNINAVTDDVISDFGRRNATGASAWHRGVDLTVSGANDLGYQLLSPVNAVITQLVVTSSGYKYIVIDGPGNQDFGFGHIFNDLSLPIKVGDLVLIQCNNINAYAIINLATHQAKGPVNGAFVTYQNINYLVSNQVQAGEVLASLGTSGQAASHVHLYHPANPATDPQVISNAKDPMEMLTHFPTSYQNGITNFNNLAAAGGSVNFPGNVYASVIVQCIMQNPGLLGSPPNQYYHSALMDIDREELFIRPKDKPAESFYQWGNTNSSYQLFQGPNYWSYISNGSRLSSTGYPSSISGPDHGSITLTGVFPYAYNNFPYDLYYFSDILTRIHKDHIMGQALLLARNTEEARYKDGIYDLFIRSTRVTGQKSANNASANNEIRIDNFRPYIKKVQARVNSATNPFYTGQWEYNGNSLVFNLLQNTGFVAGNDVIVRISSSEPLTDLRLAIGTWNYTETSAVPGTESLEWQILVPSTVFTPGNNTLRISGHDKAGNPVEGFNNLQAKPATSFPVRVSETQWQPYPFENEDVVHHLIVLDNTPVLADFFPLETTVNLGNYVSFIDLSTGGNINTWNWVFEEGTPGVSNAQNPIVQFNTLGIHIVTLTVSNSFSSSSVSGIVTVTTNEVSLQAAFTPQYCSTPKNTDVQFFDLTQGNPTQWYWDFGGAAQSSTLQNPLVVFTQTGTYDISLTVMNNNGYSQAQGTIYIFNDPDAVNVMCSVNPFMASPGSLINFQGSVLDGVPPFLYTFNFGDGTILPVSSFGISESVSHSYLSSGNYMVNVSILDNLGQLNNCTESVTILGGDPCVSLSADFTMSPGGSVFSAPINTPVTFTDASSGGTPPYLYHWVFSPDPLSGALPSVTNMTGSGPFIVTFPQVGNYPVMLHIYDNNGCGKTINRSIRIFQPQHCLVSRINKMINGRLNVTLGNTDFWDFTFVPWCGLCEDPPGSSSFPCETNNYWRLTTYPGNTFLSQKYGNPFSMQYCTLNTVNDELFQYNFTQAGRYKLLLMSWDAECNVEAGFDCQDETSLLIRVIDCTHEQEICSNNFSLQQGLNDDVYTGYITSGGPHCPMIIPAGVEISFLAAREIKLYEGFEARLNSEFHATIAGCPASSGINNLRTSYITEDVDEDSVWKVFPDPVIDWLSVRFVSDQLMPYELKVYNLLGECIIHKTKLVGNVQSLDFTMIQPGIYLLHYIGSSGNLSTKIIHR